MDIKAVRQNTDRSTSDGRDNRSKVNFDDDRMLT